MQKSAHEFAQRVLQPRVLEDNRSEMFDPALMREMGKLNFLGCTLSEYDLPGVSSVAYGLINREIEAVDSAYRSALSVQSSLVIHPINEFGTR